MKVSQGYGERMVPLFDFNLDWEREDENGEFYECRPLNDEPQSWERLHVKLKKYDKNLKKVKIFFPNEESYKKYLTEMDDILKWVDEFDLPGKLMESTGDEDDKKIEFEIEKHISEFINAWADKVGEFSRYYL
jgi:hypothetical protein